MPESLDAQVANCMAIVCVFKCQGTEHRSSLEAKPHGVKLAALAPSEVTTHLTSKSCWITTLESSRRTHPQTRSCFSPAVLCSSWCFRHIVILSSCWCREVNADDVVVFVTGTGSNMPRTARVLVVLPLVLTSEALLENIPRLASILALSQPSQQMKAK